MPFKTACSASFLIILGLEIWSNKVGYGLIYPLIACYVGDVFMGLFNTYKRRRYLFMGIVVFLMAHIGFIYYMWNKGGGFSPIIWPIPLLLCLLMMLVCRTMHLHLGKIFYPALIYCYFVSVMALISILMKGVLRMGGILFFLSDFSILFLYFFHFKEKKHKKIVHYFNLVTYYFAILLFVFSIRDM